jgi:hypothetical protein
MYHMKPAVDYLDNPSRQHQEEGAEEAVLVAMTWNAP